MVREEILPENVSIQPRHRPISMVDFQFSAFFRPIRFPKFLKKMEPCSAAAQIMLRRSPNQTPQPKLSLTNQKPPPQTKHHFTALKKPPPTGDSLSMRSFFLEDHFTLIYQPEFLSGYFLDVLSGLCIFLIFFDLFRALLFLRDLVLEFFDPLPI